MRVMILAMRICCSTFLLLCLLPVSFANGRPDPVGAANEWIDARVRLLETAGGGIHLEWTMEETPLRSRESLAAELREFSSYPDHPERASLEYQLSLLEQSRPLEHRFLYAGEGAWSIEFEMALMMPGMPDMHVRAGGYRGERWMLSTMGDEGQLTLLASGKPFPKGSNVSRFLDQATGNARVILMSGIPLGRVELVESSSSGDRWNATLSSEGDWTYRISGAWLESPRVPVVLVCETLNNDVLHTRVDNERHEWVEALGVAVPRVVRCTTRKDTVQHFLVQTAGSIPADDLENESRPPDGRRLEDLGVVSHVVFNYAEPDEAARAALASQETTSWTLDESRGSLLGAPARGERGGRTGQRTAGDGPGRSIGALQIAVVAVFIVFVSVVVVFFRVRK